MKVCLVNTPFDLFKQGYGSRFKIKKGNLPPLGIGILASVLENAGYWVKILDASALGYGVDKTVEAIKKVNPDIVGVSALTAGAQAAVELIRKLKKAVDLPVVLGGPHATCFPERMLQECPQLDAVVIGEGEKVVVDLFDSLLSRKSLSNVKSVAYINNKKIIINEKTPVIKDLDTISPPAWHLYNRKIYSPLPNQYKRLPATSLITSRGCPYSKCKFCFQAGLMKQKYRRNSPEYVVEQLEMLWKDYGIREVSFWDDNFMFNDSWIEKFCSLLRKKVPDLLWSCYGRVDTVSLGKFKMVSQAGCWSMFIGFETGQQHLLNLIGKGITLEQSRQAAKWAKKTDIQIRGSFMLGLPDETPLIAQKTINFAIELDLYSAQFLPAYPEYGTELYEIAKEKGQIINRYEGRTKAAYVPEGYRNASQLEKMVHMAYRKFYFRPKYVLKLLKQIKSFEDIKRYFTGLKFVFGLIS